MLDDIGFANEGTPAAERIRAAAREYAPSIIDSADWDMEDPQVVLAAYIDGYAAGRPPSCLHHSPLHRDYGPIFRWSDVFEPMKFIPIREAVNDKLPGTWYVR